jgi:hypothetical protein
MEELIGKNNYSYFCDRFKYNLPQFRENLRASYFSYEHSTISEEKLKNINFINVTVYDKCFETYLPQMINLETIFIYFDGWIKDVTQNYEKICKFIPRTIKTLIFYHNSLHALSNLLDNLPITTQKIIILEHSNRYPLFQYENIIEILKKKFKHIPFGCNVYFCFENNNGGYHTHICLI